MFRLLLFASLLSGVATYRSLDSTITIGVLFSKKSADVEKTLKKVEMELSQKINLPRGTVLRIRSYLFEKNSTSFYSSVTSFYDVTAGNLSMIISVDDLGKNSWITSWVCSMLRIPISFAYESLPISGNKGHSSTVFSMVPSVSEVSKAVAELARYFGWRDLAILTGEGKESAKITSKLLESMRFSDAMETKVLFHRQFNPRDHNDVNNIMQTLGVLDVRAVFLHCDSSEVKSIFSTAKKNALMAAGRVWIVTEAVIEGCSAEAFNCPPGLIGLRLRRLREPGEDKERNLLHDLIYDNVMVYTEALRRLWKNEKFPRLPLGSSGANKPLDGGTELFKLVLGTSIEGKTGLVQFDDRGNRIEPDYELVSRKEDTMEWVPVAVWKQGAREFILNRFEWPGVASFPSTGIARKRVLRVVTVLARPYVYFSDHRVFSSNDKPVCAAGYPCKVYNSNTNRSDMTHTHHCCKGLVIGLLKMLKVDVDFQADVHIVKDGKYGSRDKATGEWNGVIGEVLRGEADMAIADLTITESRSNVVDFSHPFLSAGLGVMVSVRKFRADWLIRFLEPYSWDLWVALVITVNIVIIVLWSIDRFSPFGYYRRSFAVKEKKKFNITASLWYTWGTIFHVDEANARPKSSSARVITVCFAFAMTIIATTYTANLAAVLVSEYEDFPVSKDGIRDPKFQNPPHDFKFGTISDSLVEKLFKESHNPVHADIWKNMRNVQRFDDGFEKLLSGELDAFIFDEPSLLYKASQQQNCQLRLVGQTFLNSGFGLAFPKHSPWTKRVSHVLLSYEQLDVAKNLRDVWLGEECGKPKPTVSKFTPMSVEGMAGVITIVSMGIGVALIMLFLEFKVQKHGFPLSRIWTNDPDWKTFRSFSPNPTTSSTHHITSLCDQGSHTSQACDGCTNAGM